MTTGSEKSASENSDPWQTRAAHFLSNALIYGLIKLALALPYEMRVKFIGALVSRVVGPIVGYRRRAIQNLAHIFPDMPLAKRKSIATACLDNTGRSLIENYSTNDMLKRMKDNPLSGAGLEALEKARSEGRPVVLVTGHFGNYEATRAALVARGYNVGGLYRNMSNPYFNAHYVRTMQAFGGPVFPKGRKGTAGFVRHLKSGGQLVLLIDQHAHNGEVLDFMGQPARTAVSAAELSLRFNAELIPFYGIRKPDGLGFETRLEAPIPPSNPLDMTQALNDNLAVHVRNKPEQWFWIHRRWRPTIGYNV